MKSIETLEKFLEAEYINGQGSSGISGAIRDVLTDLMHLGDKHEVVVRERLEVAEEVYEDECTLELQHKTGVTD